MWKFRQLIRGRAAGIEGAEKRHLAGLETLITAVLYRSLRAPFAEYGINVVAAMKLFVTIFGA